MSQSKNIIYLIPSLLDDEAVETIPPYVIDAVKDCKVFFVENERTARRFLKKMWMEMVIDNYEWYVMFDTSEVSDTFKRKIKEEKNIGILSEAGCPGIADPGQELIAIAQEMNAEIKPLVGPNSILLALMASGMNGQHFQFVGYLPIEASARKKAIKELEADSQKRNCTQIFIETPYRNNQLANDILNVCKPETKFCIAIDITASTESIKTKTIKEWKKQIQDLNKRPAIFLLQAK